MQIVSLSFDPDQSLLRVAADGPFSLPEAQTQFTELVERLLEHRAERVLLDGRSVTGRPGIMQRFLYGEFVADAVDELGIRGLARPPMFAYVLVEPLLDPGRFGETVAVNRGVNLKVFDNMSDAESWLGIGSTTGTDQ